MTAAILLGGISVASAQIDQKIKKEQPETAVEAKAESRPIAAKEAKTSTVAKVAQDYKEVRISELPATVQEAIAKDFDGSTISKAYVNAKGEYKVELANENAKKADVYMDSKGKLVKNELKKQ